MTNEIMDTISELHLTLKETKAIMDLFMEEYVEPSDERRVHLAIESNLEKYQYAAQVVSDLIYRAIEQEKALEVLADAECKKVS